MGTWGTGLLDSDGALDMVGDVTRWVEDQVEAMVSGAVTADSAGRLAAATGVLLQISPHSFDDREVWLRMRGTYTHLRPRFQALVPAAQELLTEVRGGGGKNLGARRGERSEALEHVLGRMLGGKREPALFEHAAGQAFMQEVAEQCVAAVSEWLGPGDDPVGMDGREFMGGVGLLLLLGPVNVDRPVVEGWRAQLRAGYAVDEEEGDEDMEFAAEYMEKAERGFSLALR